MIPGQSRKRRYLKTRKGQTLSFNRLARLPA
nr:MAG TPA: hypothetical protein [Inoviridae sp.]